ncbi:ligand-binding sensor domain-containing diguanylate cyclase [Rhodanobacter caeni]|uniref:diguanylate cyclase n=2 Tax=Rhodanobacter caeni TaxID=657654 RepID=A0ABN0UTN3_9GAMM
MVVLLLLLLSAGLPLRAQQYSLQTYDRKAGLESLSITALLQDRRGFVWAGTEMGLYRFDGNSFERMGVAQGFDKGEYVTTLAQDTRHDLLWVATQSGLRRGDGRHFARVELHGRPLVVDVGRPLVMLDDGRLLLVRNDALMVLSGGGQGKDGQGQPWQLRPMFDEAQLAALPALRRITTVYLARDRLWLGCGTAMCSLDASGRGRVLLHGPAQGVPADEWLGVLLDRAGNLWLRGTRHVSVRLGGATRFTARDLPEEATGVVKDDGRFVEDRQGRVLTTINQGLARWSGAGWTLIDSRNGLPDININAMMFDAQGSLWLGTYGRGIARWAGYGMVEGWAAAQGMAGLPNWSILRIDATGMWFGNELGGSVLQDGRTRLEPWPVRADPLPRQAGTLAKAADGAIWIGLYDRRLLRFDPASGRTRLMARLPAFIKVLHFDRQQRLWIATVNGIYRLDDGDATVQRVAAAQTTDRQCSDIAEGDDGTLWFACNDGVLRHAEGQWTRMQTGGKAPVSGFSAVAVDADGGLWLGANEPGVWYASLHGAQLQLAPVVDAWLDNTLAYFVRRDRRGWIWVGGGGGVDIFDGRRWTHLSRDDGLLWDETNQNAFFEDTDGSVWIGSPIGVSHILHPQEMVARYQHTVVVTSVMRGAEPVPAGGEVDANGNAAPLTVRYAVLGGPAGSNPRFRYRLNGSDWVDTRSHVINFTGLPSGDYRLEIQALDDDQRTVSPPTYLDFRIPRPWWQTGWAYVLEALLLALLLAAIWRWYSRRLLRQNRQLEALVSGRTAELTEEKRELERTRAELYQQATHDSLTGLHNRRAILEQLAARLESPARRAGLAVGLVDADHFKRVNDTFGHQAGDAALLTIAQRLQSQLRDGDQVGRYGGEELLVVLPNISRQAAIERMATIQSVVSAKPHRWGTQHFTVTLSIGMVWIGDEPASVEDVIRRADTALYQAKHRGRDRVAEFTAG